MSQFITKKQVLAKIPVTNTTLLRWEEDGKFPKRVKPDGKLKSKSFWVREEVDDWMISHMDRR